MMTNNEWLFRHGDLRRGGWDTVVDGELPGWQHTALRVATLADGESADLVADGVERMIIPLAGSFSVRHGALGLDTTTHLDGRSSVFEGPTDVLYLSAASSATVSGTGRVAVAEAPTRDLHPSRYLSKDEVPVELRGAGRSSREVRNFGTPGVLDAAKLIVCEVVTPAENWSSYPPHKHDEHRPGLESRLEEIYYFEAEAARGSDAPADVDPFGMFSTYSSSAGAIDTNALVSSGDVALVPYGYHGPAVAAPGYDLYYLNVMAGPDPDRVWLISDDPRHAWVRSLWKDQHVDPRLPYGREGAIS
jgi:5-deoxy-glucuronate isomerase